MSAPEILGEQDDSQRTASETADPPQADASAGLNRRSFLAALAGAGAAGVQIGCGLFEGAGGLESIVAVDNPLAAYPERGWESVYHDQYRYDRSFAWVCAPQRHPYVPHARVPPQWGHCADGAELRRA